MEKTIIKINELLGSYCARITKREMFKMKIIADEVFKDQ
jgi:hypothetical protein